MQDRVMMRPFTRSGKDRQGRPMLRFGKGKTSKIGSVDEIISSGTKEAMRTDETVTLTDVSFIRGDRRE